MKLRRIIALILVLMSVTVSATSCDDDTADFIYRLTNGLIDVYDPYEPPPDVEITDETAKKIGETFDLQWVEGELLKNHQNLEFTVTDVAFYDQITDYDSNGTFTVDSYDETNGNNVYLSNTEHDEWDFSDALFFQEGDGMVPCFNEDGSLKNDYCFMLADMTVHATDDIPESENDYFLATDFNVFSDGKRKRYCYFLLDESTGARHAEVQREYFAVPNGETAKMKLGYIIPCSWLEKDGPYMITTHLSGAAYRYIDLSE